ncbi:hypothetical protein OE88DRAFT_1645865 [Heliocybe sulcata]|uniref:N-acetyltransferase domain-containing protein n=1 Tax=Heliocybe sulcata TaxID=5364 RepID=A0A5C3N112_9AGAM|nr:hypothetical protein OE88DRAFT_1645865 [Heliocybe sulcata]
MSQRALITGVTSYIGAHIAQQLLEKGWYVRGTVRTQAKGQWLHDTFKAGDRFETVEVKDVQKKELFTEAVKGRQVTQSHPRTSLIQESITNIDAILYSAPCHLNPTTREPYLRLPHPHQNIIITPIRPADADAIIETLNDTRVYDQLASIPHPYTREHAEEWIKLVRARSDELLQQLQGRSDDQPKVVDGCPVMTLREVKEDGTEVFIGDVTIARSSFMEIGNPDERARLRDENAARPNGDPEIVYMIGDYLAPSHHGHGIMTAAIRTLVHDWAVPRMGCRKILVNVRKGNIGSRRVFEKLDFKCKGVLEDHQELTAPGRAGGPKWSIEIFEWVYQARGGHRKMPRPHVGEGGASEVLKKRRKTVTKPAPTQRVAVIANFEQEGVMGLEGSGFLFQALVSLRTFEGSHMGVATSPTAVLSVVLDEAFKFHQNICPNRDITSACL